MSTRAKAKDICCTCLSKNRKLFQLCRVPDGVNLLYSLLMCDDEAYREGFYKEPSSWVVCWECRASMKRVKQFQQRACAALRQLQDIHRGMLTDPQSLTNLSHHQIPSMHLDVENQCSLQVIKKEKEDVTNDCIKDEDNDMDFDKTELHNEYIDNGIHFNKNVTEHEEDRIEIVTKQSKKKKKMQKVSSKSGTPLKYPCSECESIFDNKGAKWKHVQKCHRAGHKCTTCEKVFTFKHNLERHQQTHRGPPPRVECPTCLKMVRKSLLATHALTHAVRQRVACNQCDKVFVCRATYESHLKNALAHAGAEVFRYNCELCEGRYRSRGELLDHVAFRHDRRPTHKCPVCDKLLATQRCVTRHVARSHHGRKENERDKMCHHCGNTFRDKKSLREHVWTHTGARPHSCVHCGRSFRQRAALHAHTRRLHAPLGPVTVAT